MLWNQIVECVNYLLSGKPSTAFKICYGLPGLFFNRVQNDMLGASGNLAGNLGDGEIWYEERNRPPALFSNKWPDFHALFVPLQGWDVYWMAGGQRRVCGMS
jgi:hypothetical protein